MAENGCQTDRWLPHEISVAYDHPCGEHRQGALSHITQQGHEARHRPSDAKNVCKADVPAPCMSRINSSPDARDQNTDWDRTEYVRGDNDGEDWPIHQDPMPVPHRGRTCRMNWRQYWAADTNDRAMDSIRITVPNR